MRHIAILYVLCTATFSAIGQVTVVPLPHQEGYFSLEDIWRVNLISAAQSVANVALEVTVEDAQHQMILSATSPVFNLLQGSNRPAFNASSTRIQYGTGATTSVLRNTGRFSYGDYIVCYRVMTANNNTLLGELCQEESVRPFSPPELISPYDGENITTFLPLLTWKPPFPPGTTPFEYTLRLVEVKERQDVIEALERNIPLLHRRGIFGTVLPYPGDAIRLETGKTYAWQVSVKAGNFELGVTEVWKFTIEKLDKTIVQKEESSYCMMKTVPDGSYYLAHKGQVRFAYYNRYEQKNLRYKIIPINGQGRPIDAELPVITLVEGMNKIDLDLSAAQGFQHGAPYIMEVVNGDGSPAYFEYIYETQ